MKTAVTFTHPPTCLSPNAKRPFMPWARKGFDHLRAKEKKRVRNESRLLMLAALGERRDFKPISYTVHWYYAGIKPDYDNVLGYCKSILDGCADACGINDRDLECIRVYRVHTLDKVQRKQLVITFTDGEEVTA